MSNAQLMNAYLKEYMRYNNLEWNELNEDKADDMLRPLIPQLLADQKKMEQHWPVNFYKDFHFYEFDMPHVERP